jgi:protein tyrosine phosphatase
VEDQLTRDHLREYYQFVDKFLNENTMEFKEHQMNVPYFAYAQPNFSFEDVISQTMQERKQKIQQVEATMKSPPKDLSLDQLETYKTRLEVEVSYFDVYQNVNLKALYKEMFFHPRYPDIYSYLWNSVFVDLNQDFMVPGFSDEMLTLPYPASTIRMPQWTSFGKTMSYSNSWARNNLYNDFVLVSAPVHEDLMLTQNDPKSIPETLYLSQTIEVENQDPESEENYTLFNEKDMNMIYFFKLMFDQNIKIIVAVCSDFKKMMEPVEGRVNVEYDESISVMNKCHLYWRTTIHLEVNGQNFLIESQAVPEENNKLYNVYNMTISNQDSSDQRTVKIFVLANWPDHQPLPHYDPDNNMLDDLIDLYTNMYDVLVDNHKKQELDRVLVHCSAGVGRTGTTILGYQMYQEMRYAMTHGHDSESFNFYDLIQNYQPDQFFASQYMKSTNDFFQNFKPNDANLKPMKEKLQKTFDIFQESKFMHYMFDNLIYYRFRRKYFIQTDDQFFFFFYYAQNLTVSRIKSRFKSGPSVPKIQVPSKTKITSRFIFLCLMFQRNCRVEC